MYDAGCGGGQYNVNVQICCRGEINRKPRAQPNCCEKTAYSKQTHKCVNGNVVRKSQQSHGQGSGSGTQYPSKYEQERGIKEKQKSCFGAERENKNLTTCN